MKTVRWFRWPYLLLGASLLLALVANLSIPLARAQAPDGIESSAGNALNAIEGLPVNQIVIRYKLSATRARAEIGSQNQMRWLSDAAQVELTYFRAMSGDAHVLRLPGTIPQADAEALAARLETLPEVEYAEPDYIMTAALAPDDTQYASQWHYSAPVAGSYGANLPSAWDITTGSPSLIVAVLDTGSLFTHPDLTGRFAADDFDMITSPTTANDGDGRDADPSDPGDWCVASARNSSWHGSHVAGTIGASSNNNLGVAGINWNSPIQTVRVLGQCGGTSSDIADAMRWAAGISVPGVPDNTTPSRVMNLSLGGGSATCPTDYQTAIDEARARNVVIVVAAGNSNLDTSGFSPANCSGVITVAATNRDGNRAPYSNFGAMIEIAAPGGDQSAVNANGVLSTLNDGTTTPGNNTYVFYQGTSMASPHVAGIVSLMLSLNPSLTPDQVLTFLQANVTAFPAGSTCDTSICGSGIVNAWAVLNAINNAPFNFVVNSIADDDDGLCELTPGDCTLREAINAANGTAAEDTITFSVDGAILLGSSLPDLSQSATIDAAGHTITLDGQNLVRGMHVNSGVTASLKNLTFQNGNADSILTWGASGGAIYNDGTLNVTNSAFSNNAAPSYGGAILNDGTLIVTNSTFFGNSAIFGGGIDNESTLTVINSTFSGNSASTSGGGIYNKITLNLINSILTNSTGQDCDDAGLLGTSANNLSSDSTCPGSTVSGDPKLGPLANNTGSTQTMALLPGSAAINVGDNTVCAAAHVNSLDQRGIARPQGAACDVGAYEARGFTLALSGGDGQSAVINTAFTNPLEVTVTGTDPVDGGDVIFTGPASGAGITPTIYTTTVTGGLASVVVTANGEVGGPYNVTASAAGATPDILFTLTNTASCTPSPIEVTNANDDGLGSLRQALATICPDGVITFDGDYTVLISSTLTVDKNVSIDGLSRSVTLDGQNNVQVMFVNGGVTASLRGLSIANGSSTGYGGGIVVSSGATLTVVNSTFFNNFAAAGSGAIDNNATLTVTNSTFFNNSTSGSSDGGGAIGNYGTLTVTNSTLAENSAVTNAGGIYNAGVNATTLQNTIIANNTGGDCSGGTTTADGHSLDSDGSCGDATTKTVAELNLGSLASNGGGTQTVALLPGSAAIDAGDDPVCAAAHVNSLDQRGIARPQGAACDAGAYEARGFTLALSGGDGQSAVINTAFTNPLEVTVTSDDPVDGGNVAFTGPASGAAITPTIYTTTVTGGLASVIVTANNEVGGPYTVTASAAGATPDIAFTLTNTPSCTPSPIEVVNGDDSGAGSLRQALTDICPDGVITFDNDYTILISSTLAVEKNVTIDGSGHAITLDGQNNVQVMSVNGGATASLKGLTIANGSFAGYGGGVVVNSGSTLIVANSTFFHNFAPAGSGAIDNNGTLAVVNSTFTSNSSDGRGGAIGNYGVLTVTNSTLAQNSAVVNGGGIYNQDANLATLYNTIVANNTGGNCNGTTTADGHNLDSDGSCGDATTKTVAELSLGSLASNGGHTQTVALLPGSAAIDAGDDTVCSTAPVYALDQRGVERTYGTACDVGAYEARGFTLVLSGGDNQSAIINTTFPDPLVISVTSEVGDPVNGGYITFTAPASGASLASTTYTATITSGLASVVVTANGEIGAYQVTAGAKGAENITFGLSNTPVLFKVYLPLLNKNK